MMHQNQGETTRQAHVGVPDGTFEEEFGRQGFFGPVSHLYHQHPPTGWSRIEGPLQPRAFDTNQVSMTVSNSDFCPQQVPLLTNASVTLSVVVNLPTLPYFSRHAGADQLWFVHRGEGRLETDFGSLDYTQGDYVCIPRGVNYRFYPQSDINHFWVIASATPFRQPDRGLLGQHALYDPDVLVLPQVQPSTASATESATGEWQVRICRSDSVTRVFYPFNPLDVVGVKGNLNVFKLAISDICPVMSHRAHLPPSVHSTFIADGFVVCSFVPRPLESADGAQRVPFFHRNIDYDEVIFYHDGDFFSRDGIQPGWVTLHPQGIHHGPHPKALANQFGKTFADEWAVMVDTEQPLTITPQAQAIGWADYWKSWQGTAGQ
jgi:homogentisate 1,2-dioxygenase